MRRLMRAIMRALAMATAMATALVWDGCRWTWRAARTLLGAPTPDVAEAVAEADAVEAPPAELTADEETGLAALALVAPFQGDAPTKPLPAHQEHYVKGLNRDERIKLASKYPDRIGRHLRGVEPIPGLPVVPTAAQHSARILDLSLDIRDRLSREDVDEANRAFSLSVIEDLLADLEQKLAA